MKLYVIILCYSGVRQGIYNVTFRIWIYIPHRAAWFGFMVLNTTYNNASVILWGSVLFVEETGELGENHRHAASR